MHFVRERKKVPHTHATDHHRMFVLWTENGNHLLLIFSFSNPYFIPISEVMYIDFMDMQCLRNIPICARFFPFFPFSYLYSFLLHTMSFEFYFNLSYRIICVHFHYLYSSSGGRPFISINSIYCPVFISFHRYLWLMLANERWHIADTHAQSSHQALCWYVYFIYASVRGCACACLCRHESIQQNNCKHRPTWPIYLAKDICDNSIYQWIVY